MPNMRKGQGPVGSIAGPSPMPRGFKAAAWTPERQKKKARSGLIGFDGVGLGSCLVKSILRGNISGAAVRGQASWPARRADAAATTGRTPNGMRARGGCRSLCIDRAHDSRLKTRPCTARNQSRISRAPLLHPKSARHEMPGGRPSQPCLPGSGKPSGCTNETSAKPGKRLPTLTRGYRRVGGCVSQARAVSEWNISTHFTFKMH